jgi:glutamyl-tRNA synthetase
MVRTRFSPSPTGMIHIGNARAALFSALFSTHSQGKFILRIEDTDAARSEQKYVEGLQDDLHWLGVDWQEGPAVGGPAAPYFQSQRHEIYDKYYRELEEQNLAYPCFCTEQELMLQRKLQLSRGHAPRYSGTCRKLNKEEIAKRIANGLKPALRFRVPQEGTIEFVDLVKGQQKFDCYDIGDFIIRRADGSSSFMFCNAIDDSLMGVTHALRGEDHLANTPRQLMILQALGMRTPQYGHLSLITGDDGSPLSKRHGSSSLYDLRVKGYLPQAVLNYLSRLSHAYEAQHLMSFNELASFFNLEKLSRAPARFDVNQLLHWQKEAVMALDNDSAWNWLGDDIKNKVPPSARDLFIDIIRHNVHFPEEARIWEEVFFTDNLSFTDAQLSILKSAGENFFVELDKATEQHQTDLKSILNDVKTKLNVSGKNLFMPVRLTLTGKENGPELVNIAHLLGAEKMRARFQRAIELVKDV